MPQKKLRLALLGCVLALVAAEIALQVIALAIWSTRDASVSPSDTETVLCVGDSFTYGLGTTSRDRAYPAAAERHVREAGGSLTFVNGGWPGNDSRDVLRELPRLLDAHHPRLVYVLVGYNDSWHRPDLEAAATIGEGDDDGGFRIEFRLGRLAAMVLDSLRSKEPEPSREVAAEPRPIHEVLGAWHVGPTWFRFVEDGRLETNVGEFQWTRDGDRLTLRFGQHEDSPTRTVDWVLDGEILTLSDDSGAPPLILARGMPAATALDQARALITAGDAAGGERALRAAMAQPALEAEAAFALVTHLAASRPDEAEREATAMVDRFDGAPNVTRGVAAARALTRVGAPERSLELLCRMIRELPIEKAVIDELNRCVEFGDPAEILAATHAALARDDVSTWSRYYLLNLRSSLQPDDLEVAALGILENHRNLDDAAITRREFVRRSRLTETVVEQALDRLAFEGPARDEVLRLFREARERPRTADVLALHLREIVEVCRGAGATPVLLTYPEPRPDVDTAVAASARAADVDVLPITRRFSEALTTTERETLFVYDGHCTDQGYDLIGQIVAADAAARN